MTTPTILLWSQCIGLYVELLLFAKIIGTNQAGKRARSSFNCISVTHDIEINEQNKSIATGLLYVQPEFDAFPTLLRGEMWISNPRS